MNVDDDKYNKLLDGSSMGQEAPQLCGPADSGPGAVSLPVRQS